MYIISLKFPQKYGFLSLNPDQLLDKGEDKVGELENKLVNCILSIEYTGKALYYVFNLV